MKTAGMVFLIVLLSLAVSDSWGDGFGGNVVASARSQASAGWFYCGTRAEAADGYGEEDIPLSLWSLAYVASYHQQGNAGWAGPSGFYSHDFRASLTQAASTSQTWRLFAWCDPLAPLDLEAFRVAFGPFAVPADYTLSVTLVAVPADVSGAPDPGTRFRWPWGTFLYVDLPVYRTDNGLDGYVFDLTATVVPEPSSLLALSAGLAGMAGVMRRRAGAG